MIAFIVAALASSLTSTAIADEAAVYEFRCERPIHMRRRRASVKMDTNCRTDFRYTKADGITDERSDKPTDGTREHRVFVYGKRKLRAEVAELADQVNQSVGGFGSGHDQLCRMTVKHGEKAQVIYFLSYGTIGNQALTWKVLVEAQRDYPQLF